MHDYGLPGHDNELNLTYGDRNIDHPRAGGASKLALCRLWGPEKQSGIKFSWFSRPSQLQGLKIGSADVARSFCRGLSDMSDLSALGVVFYKLSSLLSKKLEFARV